MTLTAGPDSGGPAVHTSAVTLRCGCRRPQATSGPCGSTSAAERCHDGPRGRGRFAKPGEYAEVGMPLFWRVETDPVLLPLAHRLVDGGYRQVWALTGSGEVPVPWATAAVDLGALARRPPC